MECLFTLSAIAHLVAEAIYTNSAQQRVIGIVKTTKDDHLNNSSSGVDGKAHVVFLTQFTLVSNPPYAKLLKNFFYWK